MSNNGSKLFKNVTYYLDWPQTLSYHPWKMRRKIGKKMVFEWFNNMKNMKAYYLCTKLQRSRNFKKLLGLRLTFCICNRKKVENLSNATERLRKDVRMKCLFKGEENNSTYNTKIYIKNSRIETSYCRRWNRKKLDEKELKAPHAPGCGIFILIENGTIYVHFPP